MAVTGMTREQKKIADETYARVAAEQQRASQGCFIQLSDPDPGEIKHAFVFADPPAASTEKMP